MSEESSHPSAKEVFADALEFGPGERQAFIESACAGDRALLADVLGLVAIHDNARNFLNLPTITGSEALAEKPGSIIGNYKLRELIGEGGFGSVFLAEQERPVRRRVALKIIKLGMDTRAVVARFEQERQALAVMDHPNIAKVFDAGATDSGRPYFVMELVKGDPITAYCDKQSLTIDERLGLFMQVCHAVQHAHTKGVIHRDIKPSNILVATQDGKPVAKVIDFGVAKAADRRFTEKTVFTEFRQLIGTPEYMSPEQAEGGLDIDTRSDVYSLGVLLYELLTGSTPFDAKRLRSAAWAELQRIIREDEPPKPSTRLQQSGQTLPSVAAHRRVEPARLGTLVRGELDWIVMKALDKDRARRYEGPGAFAADISRHIAGEPVTAGPASGGYRFRKFVSRHRGPVAAGGLIALALVAGAIGTGVFAVLEHRARDRAQNAEQSARAQAADLKRVAGFQSAQLLALSPNALTDLLRRELLAQSRESLRAAKLSDEAVEDQVESLRALLARPNLTNVAVKMLDDGFIDPSLAAVHTQFKDQPLVRAALLQSLASTLTNLGLYERAAQPQAQALEIRRRELGSEHPDTVHSISSSAGLAKARGRPDEAGPLFEEAFTTSRRVLGDDHPETLVAIVNLGSLRLAQGRREEAERLQREAIDMSRRIKGASDPDTAGILCNLAFSLGERNKYDQAVALMEEALDIRGRALGESHPDTLESVNNLGFMLVDAGRAADAERLFREAHEGRRRALGDDHNATIMTLGNIGSALRAQGKAVESEPFFRRGWEDRRRVLGPSHLDTIQALANLGVALSDCNRLDEAMPMYRESYERRLATLGPDDPRTLSSMSNLGSILDKMDRLDEAEPFVRGAYEARLRVLGPDHTETLLSQNNYAYFLERRGQYDQAEILCADVLDKRKKTAGPKNPRTLTSLHLLGIIKRGQGLYAAAEPMLKEALDGRKGHPLAMESRYWYARVLLDQRKFAEAEPEAIQLEAELQAGGPAATAAKITRSRQLLADLYHEWDQQNPGAGHDAKAGQWKAKLESASVPASLPGALPAPSK